MNQHISKIRKSIEPYRQKILHHPVYDAIKTIDDVQVFMYHHVYAVWDFMSLLKSLQHELTCTTIPWYPKGTGNIRYFINEIVVGEEADITPKGERKSHFELYLDAMQQCEAPNDAINDFIRILKQEGNFEDAFLAANTPLAAIGFVNNTFEVIHSRKIYLQAAVFTFGREDLIPAMFTSMINELNEKFPSKISKFKYYLDRHIQIDGDHHSVLALQMLEELCGNNEVYWKEAEQVAIKALRKRIDLWDAVCKIVTKQ